MLMLGTVPFSWAEADPRGAYTILLGLAAA